MTQILTGGSVIAAFFAGAVALFSPCCIVFLLPSYLAAAVKNRRWRLLPLTFLFAAGLALVLVPVTLGIGLIASWLTRYHRALYVVGGMLLLTLAWLSLVGRSWHLPKFVRAPGLEAADGSGMFALGVFAGVASSCCAPVLAGIMTLSALSSNTVGAVGLGLAYVFGMAFPLFLMAWARDRFGPSERTRLGDRPVRLHLGSWRLRTTVMNVAVAAVFAAMGVVVLVLGVTGETTAAPQAQLAIGRWLARTTASINRVLDPVPEPVLGLALLTVVAFFVMAALRPRPTEPADPVGRLTKDRCHDDPTSDQV
ncbi:MAG: cytochrome c biogenesis protein CcdA [Actinobacteria bacterium]|nr:cytochrome c biogenesis protein CcdA [Actinomycetota bacterium]